MKKSTGFYVLSFLLAMCVASSCAKSELTDDDKKNNIIEAEDYLSINELQANPVIVAQEQGVYVLKILSDKEWQAEVDPSAEWCILSSKSGVDASKVYIGFNKNEFNVDRSINIKFSVKGSEELVTFVFTQSAAETKFIYAPDAISFIRNGGDQTLNLTTSAFAWQVTVVDDSGAPVTWCNVTPTSGSGNTPLTLTAQKNNIGTELTAYLVFESKGIASENKLKISQSNEANVFDEFVLNIKDNSTDGFIFDWSNIDGATYKLTLAKDASYSEIIDDYNQKEITSGSLTMNLLSVNYDNYNGVVYAKLEGVMGNDSNTSETTYHSLFDKSSGDGASATTTYVINNERHLKNVSKVTETGKFFMQKSDITLNSATNFEPLCATLTAETYSGAFSNTYDGGNFTIKGLTNNNPTYNYVGLFAEIGASGVVKNINFEDVSITGKDRVGTVAGKCSGTVENCVVESGDIVGNTFVGGFIGELATSGSKVELCVNKASVRSDITTATDAHVGGIIGSFSNIAPINGKISKCGNFGNISSTNGKNIGGIIGRSFNNPTISQCFNKGPISGNYLVGGIIGIGNAITLIDCYNAGEVSSFSDTKASGIEGTANNKLTQITNCYNVGDISNNAGANKGYGITFGGGTVANSSTITSCYCLDGTASAIGVNVLPGGLIKSDTDMKLQTTYSGWDFGDVWTMTSGGYPKLKWEK